MAALVTDRTVDFAELRRHLSERLPAYARPLFLRIQDRIELTATFRQKKYELARAGFDPVTSSDAIYFDDPERDAYVLLDDALFRRIEAGKIRL
jgi:fatty-acyl-CoA synthase